MHAVIQGYITIRVLMAAKDVKMATDNLSCPVCYQLFKNPKYLPCHHSYCEQCLEKLQVQSKIVCPECRKEAIVPPGGVKDLDNNFFINRLVDEFVLKRKVEGEEEVQCDECSGEDPVVAFCPDCTLFLCHVCNEYHKRSNRSLGHGIVPLTELRSKKDVAIQQKPKVLMCSEHDIELRFYCETCDQLVCMYCTVKDHNGHDHDTVKKVARKYRENLKKITAPIEVMIRSLSDTRDNIEKMRKKIRQQGDEVNKKIDQHYDGMIQKLIEQKEQLKQQVHDTVSRKVKAVTIQLEEVEYIQAEVLSMKELNDAVEKSPDQEVLSVKNQVIDRMMQITRQHNRINLEPVQQASMVFVPTEVLPKLGLLCSTSIPDPLKCEIVDPLFTKYHACGTVKKVEFTVITKDKNGYRCTGGSQLSIQQSGKINEVRDCKDGSYIVSFLPHKVGELKLSVFVNGLHIKGSPFIIMVRDYTSINKPSQVVNISDRMGQPWGIAFGKNGMWAVADLSNHCVYIFDGEDQLIRKFGSKGSSIGQFDYPVGVGFSSNDHLYVVDHNNHRVQKFTANGNYLLTFGGRGSEDGNLEYPAGLEVHNNKVYVTDCVNKRISVFGTNGKFHYTFGSAQLGSPYDVAVNNNNQLLVVDYARHCIHTFTLDGDYVGKFGTKGAAGGHLNHPYGIAVDMYGFILVADRDNHRVSIFDKDGNYVNYFGSKGSAIGQFLFPYGVAVSPNGKIYVSDCDNKRIQIFSC